MKNLQITITLEEDRKTINLVDTSGNRHYVKYSEENERYQQMTVAEFIAEHVEYYEWIEEIYEGNANGIYTD